MIVIREMLLVRVKFSTLCDRASNNISLYKECKKRVQDGAVSTIDA